MISRTKNLVIGKRKQSVTHEKCLMYPETNLQSILSISLFVEPRRWGLEPRLILLSPVPDLRSSSFTIIFWPSISLLSLCRSTAAGLLVVAGKETFVRSPSTKKLAARSPAAVKGSALGSPTAAAAGQVRRCVPRSGRWVQDHKFLNKNYKVL